MEDKLEKKHNYKLLRVGDGLVKYSFKMGYVEWYETGEFKSIHDEPAIGRSLLLNPQFGLSYTWLTTMITSFVEESDSLHFYTENSEYFLYKI